MIILKLKTTHKLEIDVFGVFMLIETSQRPPHSFIFFKLIEINIWNTSRPTGETSLTHEWVFMVSYNLEQLYSKVIKGVN